MRCPNCGYEIGPLCNAASTAPLAHLCGDVLNAAAADPIAPLQWNLWQNNAAAACAPPFTGLIYRLVLP
ncbi:MAG: hypothetical protein M3P26_16310 [Gemmatimonadota bacterium]|nr:hypothetical protein [Gemmatimonadota bacterium]